MSVEDMQAMVTVTWEVWANPDAEYSAPTVIVNNRLRRRKARANHENNIIDYSRHPKLHSDHTTLHEVAHLLLFSYGIGWQVPAHGPIFVGLMIRLLEQWGIVGAKEARMHFTSRGVDVRTVQSPEHLADIARGVRERMPNKSIWDNYNWLEYRNPTL